MLLDKTIFEGNKGFSIPFLRLNTLKFRVTAKYRPGLDIFGPSLYWDMEKNLKLTQGLYEIEQQKGN